MTTTSAEWAEILNRLRDARFTDTSFNSEQKFVSVKLDDKHYVKVLDAGKARRAVQLIRFTWRGGNHVMEEWRGLRGLNDTVTAVRRAKLALEESLAKN